jgi:hypothetical protein
VGDGEAEDLFGVGAELLSMGFGEGCVLLQRADAACDDERRGGEGKAVGCDGGGVELARGGEEELLVLENAKLEGVFEKKVWVAGLGDELLPSAEGHERAWNVLERPRAWVDPFPVL